MRLRTGAVTVLAGASLLTPEPARAQTPVPVTNVDRIRQRLETPSPVRDTIEMTAPPTFRVSVSEERIDIRRFWGEPDAVGANVHAPGGPWHHEYQDMVVPDEFSGWGYTAITGNAATAALAAQSMGAMLAMKYVPVAISKVMKARAEHAAKAEVQLALEEFYASHPEARPAYAVATPP